MANAHEMGIINESIDLSNGENNVNLKDNTERNSVTVSSGSQMTSHDNVQQGSCEEGDTNLHCQFIVSHTKLAFGRFQVKMVLFPI